MAQLAARARRWADGSVPSVVRRAAAGASRHHTVTLAAGLAFFGLLSFAPALSLGLGVLQLVAGDDVVRSLTTQLEQAFPQTLALAQLLAQVQGRASSYAGIGLVLLLWPATTLASGWTRALDAIEEVGSTPGLRGVAGRLKGLAMGVLLLAGTGVLLAAMLAVGRVGATGLRAAAATAAVAAAFVFQTGFCVLLYRVLPSVTRPWRDLWPGALVAASTVVGSTGLFALLLTIAGGLARRYPPTLSTALAIGVWLYVGNIGLLLGAELNAARRPRP